MFLIIVMYAVLASTFIFAKKALAYADPFFLIGFRMLLAGGMLLGWQFFSDRRALRITKKDWGTFFKVSLFHIYFAFILDFWSLQYLTALKSNLIYATTPFVAAFLSYILLKERLWPMQVVGMVVGAMSTIPVCLIPDGQPFAGFGSVLSVSLPELALFGAVLSASYAWFMVKDLMERGYGFLMINGVAMLVGGALSMFTWAIRSSVVGFTIPVSDWTWFLIWILALILAANFIFYNLYGYLLRSHSITLITLSGFLCPSFGAVYEWLFMGGHISWHYWVSLGLVTVGLYLFYSNELLKKKQMAEK